MGLPVYDYRKDIRNVLVTPEIRSRFLRLEPGQETEPHTHDLGHEVFLVLQGRARFEIADESDELGPGQMCVALAGQPHAISVWSEEPMIMYLSVTPHIQPTHTRWDEQGNRLPHRFTPSSAYDVSPDMTVPLGEVADDFVKATAALAEAARRASESESVLSSRLKEAMASGEAGGAGRIRGEMWDALFPVYRLAYELASKWNDLAPRAGES